MRFDYEAVSPDVLRSVREELLSSLHVALPGIVESWNPDSGTVTVRPGFRGRLAPDADPVPMPLIRDVPVFLPRFSDPSLTLTVAPGDFCLLVFADRNIDGWLETGAAVEPPAGRKHDLSDAFAFVGFSAGGGST